jgi:hypothetical protein
VPGHEYDIIYSNHNTIDVDRSQSSNNVVCMEGEYVSVEPDGQLTTNINWGQKQQLSRKYMPLRFYWYFDFSKTLLWLKLAMTIETSTWERLRERERERE